MRETLSLSLACADAGVDMYVCVCVRVLRGDGVAAPTVSPLLTKRTRSNDGQPVGGVGARVACIDEGHESADYA
jgi:hypothetical protein